MPPKKPSAGKKATKPASEPVPLDAIKHLDTRSNIPTRENQALAFDHEDTVGKVLYPRDPSLDPQLVWKGKDEQDAADLEVPAPPIYIQEKIHPQAIIEDIRARATSGRPKPVDLFSDFNGLEEAKRTEFYKHPQHWSNRMILGDSLLVMTSLAEKERLRGRVQMVYIDPPYGIKFGSNWQVSTRKRDVKDGKLSDLTAEREVIRAFRDTWEFGIHSYLKVWRDRLAAARALLTESGSVFVQIGEENVHLVRCLMDEVFGNENFVSLISFRTTTNIIGNYLGNSTNYLLWYSRQKSLLKYRQIYEERTFADDVGGRYSRVELPDGTRRFMTRKERDDISSLPAGSRIYRHGDLASPGPTATGSTWFEFEGHKYYPGKNHHWKTSIDGLRRLGLARRLAPPTPNSLAYVRYLNDFPVGERTNVWMDTITGAFTDDKVYVVQTNTKVIERCMLMATDPGDLVLDPTCGSGTSAYVAEQWGRRWITIDTSRVALTLARARLMAGRFPYYLLADSPEGRKKEAELTGTHPPGSLTSLGYDIHKGFVYKRVPHVTLKSIANNPDIKEGMTREQVEAAIRKHTETETLYDQPYEDKNTVRVTGPFTVESLSPHRLLPTGQLPSLDTITAAASEPPDDLGDATGFVKTILDNLRKAGVQNTRKEQRLHFDELEPYANEYIHARGVYSEGDQRRWVAVCVGPEFGTIGPELLRRAGREANKGVGFDLLLMCGFAFDPLVYEDGKEVEKQLGRVKVWFVRMNADLAMGDDLKKSGAGNLFTVFGEPDIDIRTQAEGKLVVEIRGLDVYDPTTGEVRSGGTDDIACWFIDTAYDEDSFFVRHAYFLGADEPYEKLKRALKADIDEGEWAKLYSATSAPFDVPKSGKIAVKVINHYGDEVLKVYPVGGPQPAAKKAK